MGAKWVSRNMAQSTVDQRSDGLQQQQGVGWGHTRCQGISLSPLLIKGSNWYKEQEGWGDMGAQWVPRNVAQSTVDQRGDWSKEQKGWGDAGA